MAPTRKRTWKQRRDGAGGEGRALLDAKSCTEMLTLPGGMDRLTQIRAKLVGDAATEKQQLDWVIEEIDRIDFETKSMVKRSTKKAKELLADKKREKNNLSAQKCRAKNNMDNYAGQIALIDMAIEFQRQTEALRRVTDAYSFSEQRVRFLTQQNIKLELELEAHMQTTGIIGRDQLLPSNLDVSLYKIDDEDNNNADQLSPTFDVSFFQNEGIGCNNSKNNSHCDQPLSPNLDRSFFQTDGDGDQSNNVVVKLEVEESADIMGPVLSAVPSCIHLGRRPSTTHNEHSYSL